MWLECAKLRSGGLTYDQISARLSSAENMAGFGLIEVPSGDAIRHQLNKRRLASNPTARDTVLADDELDSHLRSLIYFGILLDSRVDAPGLDSRPRATRVKDVLKLDAWSGFLGRDRSPWTAREPELAEEFEAEALWPVSSGDPRRHPLYTYFLAHLESTDRGAGVAGMLERVHEQAAFYLGPLRRFMDAAKTEVQGITRETSRGTTAARNRRVDLLVSRLHPSTEPRRRPASDEGNPDNATDGQLADATEQLTQAWEPLVESIRGFRAAITPSHLLMRVVRDGGCDICA